jgi:hypothetical protein
VSQRPSRLAVRGASSCQGSTSRAVAIFAIQSSVGLVAALSTANTCERDTPAKSARAVRATGFRFAAARTFRATSRRSSCASTASTVEGVRHHGIRYPGLALCRRRRGDGVTGKVIPMSGSPNGCPRSSRTLVGPLVGLAALLGCAQPERPPGAPQAVYQQPSQEEIAAAQARQMAALRASQAAQLAAIQDAAAKAQAERDAQQQAVAAQYAEVQRHMDEQSAQRTEAIEASQRAAMQRTSTIEWQTCRAVYEVEGLKRRIVAEKANPSGVVDLRVLHDLGEDLQAAEPVAAEEKRQFRKERGRDFTTKDCDGNYP